MKLMTWIMMQMNLALALRMSKDYPDSEFEVTLDESYSKDQREAIAAEIISFVRQRTLSGKSVTGGGFPKYSSQYVNSVDFKAARKSTKPNLRLSGDMLAYMELVKNETGKLVIGYGDENPEAGKAEGNQIGSYGGSANSGKARKFLGIKPEDLNRILSKYPIDSEKADLRAAAVLKAQEKVDEFANKIQVEGADETDYKVLKDKLKLKVGR